jgi:mRNA interferase MazF
VLVCFISTQFKWQINTDIIIESSNFSGLKKDSLLKIGKIATIDKNLVLGKIGTLEQNYISQLNKNLIKICNLR